MMATDRVATFAIAFTLCYAAIYVACTELNVPLLTYHPVIGEIDFLWKPSRQGPAMYWYGWMLTAFIGAAALAFGATLMPEPWLQRTILFGALAALSYLVLYSLALLVYDKASVELEFLTWRWPSVVAAVIAAAIGTAFAPAQWSERLWPGWTWSIPLGALVVLGYYLTPYFTR